MKLKIEIDIPNGTAFDLAKVFHERYKDIEDYDKGNVIVYYSSKGGHGGEAEVSIIGQDIKNTEQVAMHTVDALQTVFNYV